MKIKSIIFISIISSIFLLSTITFIITPDKKHSITERRALKQFPELTAKTFFSGIFMNQFEDYVLDQFPLRDSLRKINVSFNKYIIQKTDVNGFFIYKNYICKKDYPLNLNKVSQSLFKINNVYKNNISSSSCNVYFSVIPDKNYFINDKNILKYNYSELFDYVKENTTFANYIDITDTLNLECFYKTDQHWKQNQLFLTAQKLLTGMNNEYINIDFTKINSNINFYGTYYGQALFNVPCDELFYLNSKELQNCSVTYYGSGVPSQGNIYNYNKLISNDPYEFFLNGSEPLIEIINPNSTSTKELIIFRDSFGSSIAPLFINNYSKITLVDLRYLNSSFISNYIEFTNQDVLFLYSTLVLNAGL